MLDSPLVYLLLTTLMTQQVCAKDCTEGWFGNQCEYQCHCAVDTACDTVSGECPVNISCRKGFFGPGCQYADIAMLNTSVSSPGYYLRDGNEHTCNPDVHATTLEIIPEIALPFSWFRIQVNDYKHLLNFTTTLNNAQACVRERKFKMDETTVDVTCDVNITLTKLRIDGFIVGSICSIYISTGRNVALKQKTSQTSTYNQDNGASSGNAVDGNTDSDFNNKHCMKTDGETAPSWHLNYSSPKQLYLIRIYNKADVLEDETSEFQVIESQFTGSIVETFDEKWLRVSYFENSDTIDMIFYDMVITSQIPVTYLRISQDSQQKIVRVMSFCEVETYGDNVCPHDTYGLFCQETCTCAKTEVCFPVTGACAPGCQRGFYGSNCTSPCSNECLLSVCEWRTGNCLQCIAGYIGGVCTQVCSPGTFGQDCRYRCSERCSDTCHHIYGNCTCRQPYSGELCSVTLSQPEEETDYRWLGFLVLLLLVLMLVFAPKRRFRATAEKQKLAVQPLP